MDEKQLDMLRHMLGLNDPRLDEPKFTRNYAAVDPGEAMFVDMAAAGLVEKYRDPVEGFSPYEFYRCTESGIAAAKKSFKSIQWTKSQRRYCRFLDMRDSFPDLTFREFLIDPYFKKARA